ncbi:hypothetical protein [Vagococcus carniphilus]|uniref:hypothetical protein n=1 Tax=Vagococcus carniphilus TaxID=218144 RepID=UPI003B5A303D
MKLLIGQPKFEVGVNQLRKDLEQFFEQTLDLVIYPEGYFDSEAALKEASLLAKEYSVSIISSVRKDGKDIAVVINSNGKLVYFREKTEADDQSRLRMPLVFSLEGRSMGYLLCMEVLKGIRDFPRGTSMDLIVHPIGVGMFSEEQLNEWVTEDKKIAIKNECFIVGTSHADGSYKNCGHSIPIAYCFDQNGDEIFLQTNKVTSKIVEITC